MENIKIIKTSDGKNIEPFLKNLYVPPDVSHKGQNGKVLIIGGSKLFHASPLWSAEVAAHFCDMVHFASTKENNEIFQELKKTFRNGMIVEQKDIEYYAREDDAVLIGPGMMRGENEEAAYTKHTIENLLQKYPDKKFVLDAGALQNMQPDLLMKLSTPAIITPHQKEFQQLFAIPIIEKKDAEKIQIVKETSKKYNCTILLKAVIDIISDGEQVMVVEGGNAGLTKGGSGDILAGLTAALYAKNTSLEAAVLASFLIKKTADSLFTEKGYWYSMNDLIQNIPAILKKLLYN